MKPLPFSGHYGGAVEIDVCSPCTMFWLDAGESMQLTPASTVDIFRMIHEASDEAHTPLQSRLKCVRCTKTLLSTHDNVLGTRLHYYRCPAEHGRMISFTHFLAEKRFIRELTAVERMNLSAKVQFVRCDGCGAQVDLATSSACGFCQAPVRVLDAEAATKALEHYAKVQNRARDADHNKEMAVRLGDHIIDKERYRAHEFDNASGAGLVGAALGALLGAMLG